MKENLALEVENCVKDYHKTFRYALSKVKNNKGTVVPHYSIKLIHEYFKQP